MKPLTKFSDEYFDKYSDTPVKVKPFDPKKKELGLRLLAELKCLLASFPATEEYLTGSTALEIAGKGDLEFGIFPSEKDWDGVRAVLTDRFGPEANIEEEFIRVIWKYEKEEIDVSMLRGHEGAVILATTQYLLEHPELRQEYEQIKYQYAYSKKEYQREKNRFFQKVAEIIPEQTSS